MLNYEAGFYRKFDVTPQNPIITKPYISSTDRLRNKWEEILSLEKRPIIGINWQGNPKTEQNVLKGRSLDLNFFSIKSLNKKRAIKKHISPQIKIMIKKVKRKTRSGLKKEGVKEEVKEEKNLNNP